MKNFKINKKVVAALLLSGSLALTGCGEVKCDVEPTHAHYYTGTFNNIPVSKYIPSEYEYVDRMKRTDKYIEITEEQKKEYDSVQAEQYKNVNFAGILLKVDENPEYIEYLKDKCQNEVEYKCVEERIHQKGTYPDNPANNYMATSDEETFYTYDPNNEYATGEKRLTYYTFYGYNVYKDDNGEYSVERSIDYYNIEDVVNNCTYIGSSSYNKHKTEDQEFIKEIEIDQEKTR